MSYFAIKVRKIEKVWAHPNADAMQMAKVQGLAYQFVVGLDIQPDDLVVYFPLESVIPDKVKAMMPETVSKKLGGIANNRVVTARLRGVISQGIALAVDNFKFKMPFWKFWVNWKTDGFDLTPYLGVVKYEPPAIEIPNAKLYKLPPECPKYDIQSCDVFEDVLKTLMNQEVVITEKVEGQNNAILSGVNFGLTVCQHFNEIIPEPGKMLNIPAWRAARNTGLDRKVTQISTILHSLVNIRSELVGRGNPAFKNYYELDSLTLYTFDIWLNGLPIDFDEEQKLVKEFEIQYVPIIARGILKDILGEKTIQEYADGKSKINPKKLREGIVIRPVKEQSHPAIGRLILKQHSAKYLIKKNKKH